MLNVQLITFKYLLLLALINIVDPKIMEVRYLLFILLVYEYYVDPTSTSNFELGTA